MDIEEITKKFENKAKKDLYGKDALWKLEYCMALGWFGEFIVLERFTEETAKECARHIDERQKKELPKESPGFDAGYKLVNDTMLCLLKYKIRDTLKLAKKILEIDNSVHAEASRYFKNFIMGKS